MQVEHLNRNVDLASESSAEELHLPSVDTGTSSAAQVLWLSDTRALSEERYGNKASNLARLVSLNMPVPRAFVIEGSACLEHVSRCTSAAERGNAAALADAIRETALLPRLEMEVVSAYAELITGGDLRKGVAVRSSASGEDSETASCAGQYETILHVTGVSQLSRAIRQCWASAWSHHVVEYRRKWNLDAKQVAVAVIVQLQLDPEFSGVMFTKSPVASYTDSLLVSASYGLGESIVQGMVTPDEFELDRSTFQVLRRSLGSKAAKTALADVGTRLVDLPAAAASQYCISDARVTEIARCGISIERSYASPQDIEWAIEDDRLYILQTRPITRSNQQEGDDSRARGYTVSSASAPRNKFLDRWKSHFGDHFPDPLMPMDFSSTVETAVAGIAAALRQLGLRLPAAEKLIQWQPDGTIKLRPQRPRLSLQSLLAPATVLGLLRVDLGEEWREKDRPYLRKRLEQFPSDLTLLSDQQLVERAFEVSTAGQDLTVRRFAKYFIPGLVHEQIVNLILARCVPPVVRRAMSDALLKGIPHLTAEVNAAIQALAHLAAADPQCTECILSNAPDQILQSLRLRGGDQTFLERLSEFLVRYGVRCTQGMIPVPSYSTWSEKPEVVLGMIQSIVRNGSYQEASRQAESQAHLAEIARGQVAQVVASWEPSGKLLQRLFLWSLAQLRSFIIVREESLFFGEQLIAHSRRILAEAGGRLHDREYLKQPADVLFLRVSEMSEALLAPPTRRPETRELVMNRRQQYEDWKQQNDRGGDWLSLALGQSADQCSTSGAPIGGVHLRGLAASAGKVRGRVKVVLDQSDLWRVNTGDILVCRATAPAWTAVFGTIAGIVTDIGGVLSHAAIVAREYQIPAVLGTVDATRKLTDGMEVLVDGELGHVTIL